MDRLLRDGDLLHHIGDEIWRGAQALHSAAAATATELHSKFCQDAAAFTLSFSGLSTFFGGLEGLIGPPNPRLMEAMAREHLDETDSRREYTTSNYSVTTTSEIEWWFVNEAHDGLAKLGLKAWPTEARSMGQPRRPTPLAELEKERQRLNQKLDGTNTAPLGVPELVAARM